jgi:uncharacterized membrane protein YebE (DUF533 family)
LIRTGLLVRLFGQGARHGDQAAVLAAHAGEDTAADESSISRRHRWLPLPGEVVAEVLAGKVLHAWLQNQHQTLYPLTVNLRTLDAGRAALLARMMALAILAGAAPPSPERMDEGVRWLAQVGGSGDVEEAFRAALSAPDPLRVLLHEIQVAGLAAYAYVVSLVATDPRDEAGQIFLDYLAVRLALPANVVRSADRRYRGLSRPYDRGQSSASVRPVSAP